MTKDKKFRIRTADDIFRDKEEREREEFKEKVVTDLNKIFKGVLKKTKPKDKMVKKFKLLKWGLVLFSFLFLLTIILGLIWLIKFFVGGIIL